MRTYAIIQDNDDLEHFHDAQTTAAHLYGIAEAMRPEAESIDNMALSISTDNTEHVEAWRHYGAYLDLRVEREG